MKQSSPPPARSNAGRSARWGSWHSTLALRERVPQETLLVTESGILLAADVALMRDHGVGAFLVGEAFMRAADPGARLAELFSSGGG